MNDSNTIENTPTPKTDFIEHLQNFGEAGMYFSGSMGLALATVYFRQLEIVLATAYITALIYSALSFDNAPRMTFFRVAAITTGVVIGIRELLILFWIPVTSVIIVVLAIALIIYLGYRHLQIVFTQEKKR